MTAPVVEPQVLHRTLLGRPSPFLGRDAELMSLLWLFEECVAQRKAKAALLVAPTGIGKSRLRAEMVHRLRERAPLLLMSRGDPVSTTPYGLLASALAELCDLRSSDSARERRRKLTTRLGRHLSPDDAARVATFLGEAINEPAATEDTTLRVARSDLSLMRDLIARALEDWLAAECEAQPALWVLEDLHWGDLPTLKLIEGLLVRLRGAPLLVLALARPEVKERFPDLFTEYGVEELPLRPLPRQACEALVREALGEVRDPAVPSRLAVQCEGNPLFLEELCRAVAAGQHKPPEMVRAALRSRLAALPEEARRVLSTASVFGQLFSAEKLAALWALTSENDRSPTDADSPRGQRSTVDKALSVLLTNELITPRGPSREGMFAFRHELLREAAYEALTEQDRTRLHLQTAELFLAEGERDPVVLAEHLERGKDYARARVFFVRAAERAYWSDDLAALSSFTERALALGVTGETRGEICLYQSFVYHWRNDIVAMAEAADEARALLPRHSERWFRATSQAVMAYGNLGNKAPLLALVREIAELPDALLPSEEAIAALGRAHVQALHHGWYEDATRLYQRALSVKDAIQQSPMAQIRLHDIRAMQAAYEGDIATYLLENQAGAQLALSIGYRLIWIYFLGQIGYAHALVGQYPEAEEVLKQAINQAERLGFPFLIPVNQHNLGLVLARRGALEEAQAVELSAALTYRARKNPRMEAACRNYLAKILMLARSLEDAEREARAAIALAEDTPAIKAQALSTLAQILVARRASEALTAAEEAMEILSRLGSLDEGEHLVRSAYGEALLAAGRREEARTVLLAARERLLAQADKISDPRLRLSFLNRVHEHARLLALAHELEEE